jgi:HlyD family secretion protein
VLRTVVERRELREVGRWGITLLRPIFFRKRVLMRRWLLVLVPAVILFALIGWRLSQKKAAAAADEQQRIARQKAPVVVQTANVARRDIIKTFEAVGSVESPMAVELRPKITGRITYLAVREGAQVQAGQVLARLDPTEVQAEVRLKEATVAQARARLLEAELGQGPNDVALSSEVSRQQAAVTSAQATSQQAQADYGAQIASAQATITDAQGRITAAEANIASADAAINAAEANLANARTQQARQEALFKEGATAKELLDNARTAVKVQEGALGQAKEQRSAAVAARDSAIAQRKSAEKQAEVVTNKAKADRAAAQATVKQAQATLKAAQANTQRNPAYRKNLEALRAVVLSGEADLNASRSRLNDTTLLSPITGVVTQRDLDNGALATPTQTILTVQAVKQLWVTVAVPEEISRKIFQAQPASITFDALPGDKYTGKIVQILPAADPQSRQFTVRVRVDNAQNRIKPGMFGRVTFETDRANGALVVPLEAVQNDPEKPGTSKVTIVTPDNKAETREVQTGLADANVISVRSGLQEGEPVVLVTGRPLKDGQAVKTGGGKDKGGKGGGEGPKPEGGSAGPPSGAPVSPGAAPEGGPAGAGAAGSTGNGSKGGEGTPR